MKRSLLFGLFCLPVGFITNEILRNNGKSDDPGFWIFEICVAVASVLSPSILWYFIIERKNIVNIKRGLTVGLLGVELAHFLSWYFFLLINYLDFFFVGNIIRTYGSVPINPLFGIIAALTYSLVSLFLFGLIHFPIGGLMGGMYARKLQNK